MAEPRFTVALRGYDRAQVELPAGERFQRGRMREGYDIGAVDEWIDAVQAAARG